jgi:hypothetical protein
MSALLARSKLSLKKESFRVWISLFSSMADLTTSRVFVNAMSDKNLMLSQSNWRRFTMTRRSVVFGLVHRSDPEHELYQALDAAGRVKSVKAFKHYQAVVSISA